VEESLLGHLLKANDPATQRLVEERLASDPSAPHDLAVLRAALAPLAADREEFEPPSDLWVRTLGRVAEYVVEVEGRVEKAGGVPVEDMIRRAAAAATVAGSIRPAPRESATGPGAPRRNIFAFIALSVAVVALVLPAVVHVRARSQQLACQDSMRQFHQAAVGFSEHHDGRFPQVGDGEKAATVVDTLKTAGYLPESVKFVCPAAPAQDGPVAMAHFAYTLGYRDPDGILRGLERKPQSDLFPIFADAPLRNASGVVPVNHRHGQNVLFAGGKVEFRTNPFAGPNGDDIFYNQRGRVGAGVNEIDCALGRNDERP
jgi:hypothetical protein